jgi:hypothetical protein
VVRLATVGFSWAALAVALASPAAAQDRPVAAIAWRTGADFQKQLQVVTSVQWQEAELRERLENLAGVHRVAIFLDRRIDPQQKLDFASTGAPLESLLSELAQELNAATARIGPVIYIGPPPTAGAISASAPLRRKEISRQAGSSRIKSQAWSWPELAEPRQLLADLAREHGLSVANPQAIPHDLWPAADLPPLELADRLTLLLAGFHLTFKLPAGGTTLELAPLPADAEYEQSYAVGGDAAQLAATLKREFPRISLRRDGTRLVIRGKNADHQRIAGRLSGTAGETKASSQDNTRYTLTVRNESAGAVVSTVAKRLGKQLQCSAAVREKLAGKVSFIVRDATLDELMVKTLQPLGLTYRLTEEAIEVLEEEP